MSYIKFFRYLYGDLKKAIAQKRILYEVYQKYPSVHIEEDVQIKSPKNLVLGENVVIQKGAILHCGGMEWCDYKGKITAGSNSFIGPYSVLFGAGEIVLGDNVLLSPFVCIASHQHSYKNLEIPISKQPIRYDPVIIEDDVWIGMNALILPGTKIGKGAIIAAGSVVRGEVDPYTIVGGSPSKVIKKRVKNESD